MALKDLIIKNRSTRGYDRSRLVKDEEMREMIDCARLSASSMALQPLKFYLTNDLEECAKITDNVGFAGALPGLLPKAGQEPVAYIAICHDKRLYEDDKRFLKDVGIYAQTISLAATEMGLNALMIGAFDAEKMRQLLGLPDYFTVLLMMAVGKSVEHIELTEIESLQAPENPAEWEEYRKTDQKMVKYYRKDDVHYVPKRKLDDFIINK